MSYGVPSTSTSTGLESLFTTPSADGSGGTGLRPFANLDLTEAQRTKIRTILKNAQTDGTSPDEIRQEINGVLTSAQLAQLQAGTSSGSAGGSSSGAPGGNPFSDPNGPFANLNLTSSQQSQISTILSGAKSQGLSISQINAKVSGVLTSTQQATFTADLANLPQPPGAPGSADTSTGASSSNNLFANLNLTADQKSKIDTILANAKTNGTSASDTLSQIEDVLTSSQQGLFFEDVQNAQASVSGLFQSGDGTATSSNGSSTASSTATAANGLSEANVQNQVAAANALILQQLQSEAGVLT